MPFDALRQTQPASAKELSDVISAGMMPNSILISGSRGSSRLTGALDLAFYHAGGDRELLKTGNVAYFASRSFRSEFETAANLFRKHMNRRSRLFFIQTVRKILLQYHSALTPLYKEKAGIKGSIDKSVFPRLGSSPSVSDAASQIDEVLLSIEEDRDYGEKETADAVNAVAQLMTGEVMRCGKKTHSASIEEIRAVQEWLQDGSDRKAVIFENIEDYSEGSKNSLLKVLEEPPESALLILVSANQPRIMETILSRVRKFSFPVLSEKAVSDFIGASFSIYGSYRSFDSFFFEQGADEDEKTAMDDCIRLYSDALLSGRRLQDTDLSKMLASLSRIDGFEHFRQELYAIVTRRLEEGTLMRTDAKRIWNSLSRYLMMADSYNMSIRLALDYALREVADV